MPTQSPRFDWRQYLPVHPAAELFPLMAEAELKELAEDIKTNGLRSPIVMWPNSDKKLLLIDGRNRLDALALLGLLGVDESGCLTLKARSNDHWQFQCAHQVGDPYALALSFNVRRRHLTAEQKRGLIAKLLKAKPEASDREIAKQVKADHKTVGAVRSEKEGRGEIPHKAERAEAGGRKARGRKPAEKSKGSDPAATTSKANVDTGLPARDRREADLRRTFTDAVHTLISLTSHPSARFAGIVPPGDLVMVANFLTQIAALKKPDDATASAEAMKAKHAAADPALIPDDLSIPPSLRRAAGTAS
jgi:ParB-like nuclease domain